MQTSYRSTPEIIRGHKWEVEANYSDYGKQFYWRLYKDGEHMPIEIDSVPQRLPETAKIMAHHFTLGLNAMLDNK